MHRAGLDPGEVEQVADQPRQAVRLLLDRTDQRDPVLGTRSLLAQPCRGGPDRRQRRAQVVGDRVEDDRLRCVSLPRCLGLSAPRGGCLTLGRDVEQARERRGDPVQIGLGPGRRAGRVEPDRSGLGREPQGDLAGVGLRRGAGVKTQLSLAGGLQAGRDSVDQVIGAAQQCRRRVGEHRRLTLSRSRLLRLQLGFGRSPPRLARQTPDHQCGEEQDTERHHVVRVGDRQLVERLDEEVVEDQHADDRGGESCHLAAADRHREDGDQVDAAQACGGRNRVEDRYQRGRKADPDESLESRGGDAAGGGPRTLRVHLGSSLGAASAGRGPRWP